MIHETTDARFLEDVLAAPGLTLLEIRPRSHAPSRMQRPILERFARLHPDIRIVALDADKHPQLAANLGANADPSVLVFQDGFALAGARGLLSEPAIDRLLHAARRRAEAIPQA